MRQKQRVFSLFLPSPSSRRAWIEIKLGVTGVTEPGEVALLAEGVDRNLDLVWQLYHRTESPSSRRAWIEITR